MRRPGPLRWLWYALGGGLPAENQSWVLHDVTARHWRWRALLRSLVQVAPVALLLYLLLPTPPWVRVMAVGGGVLVGMIYAVAYLDESTEYRAVKAGYPRGTATQIRTAPSEDAERDRRDRRRERRPDDGPGTTGSPE